MSGAAALTEPSFNMDKLSYEIFSILESKFLSGYDDPKMLLQAAGASPAPAVARATPSAGRVRILSVDAGGATDGLLAAASLARLESSLKKLSGEPSARVTDFFDVAAGSGAGGVLVALLFTRGADGRPLFSAAEALEFLARNRRVLQPARKRRAGLSGVFCRRGDAGWSERTLRRVFGDATLRDTVKPVLIPCYDLSTGAPFLFSRADAIETDGYDFLVREVCAATVGAVELRSIDGRTAIAALDGGVAAGNPAAAAITHVLNNRMEFPFVAGVEDLLMVSLGNGESAAVAGRRRLGGRLGTASPPEVVRIAGEGASDMVRYGHLHYVCCPLYFYIYEMTRRHRNRLIDEVDQAVSMAFGHNRTKNYVRIQANGCDPAKFQSSDAGELLAAAAALLVQRGVESVLFGGKRVSERTNAENLERAAAELVMEHNGRKRCPIPVVVVKQGSPRSSSSSVLSSSCSNSPMVVPSPR